MKRLIIGIVIVLSILSFSSHAYTAGDMRKIAEISLGEFMPDKINLLTIQDPDMPFVTIFLTHVVSGSPIAFADPSNNSIATRLTGKITKIVKTMNPEVINLNKSIGWKTLKIARMWDEPTQSLVYVTYSTQVLDGSLKHSISAVSLGEDR